MTHRKRENVDGHQVSGIDDDNCPIKSKYFSQSNRDKTEKLDEKQYRVNRDQIKPTKRLTRADYQRDGITLAKYLLGKILCHQDTKSGALLSGRIVETEAYLGVIDKACHTFGGKQTERVKPMYEAEGTSYVYSIYGMYYCLNISSSDYGGCVLLRGLEPIQGLDIMCKYREKNRHTGKPTKSPRKSLKTTELCNGPSKLCQALNITKDNLNNVDMATNEHLYLLDDGFFEAREQNANETCDRETIESCDQSTKESRDQNTKKTRDQNTIVCCKRIGISGYGEESASKLYRFYVKGNRNVSVVDKLAEVD